MRPLVETKQKMDRAYKCRRLCVIQEMLKWWPDMSEETKSWMIAERNKLIAVLELD